MHKVSGAVVAETEYGVSDAARGLTKLDLRELELKDMEVARKIQEEELKVRWRHRVRTEPRSTTFSWTSRRLTVTHFTLCG